MTLPRVQLAVLGDPLSFTRSPELHRAGLESLGLEGESLAIRTPVAELAARLLQLATEGYRGANLTHPLKHAVIPHLARVSDAARRARSVNTVGFDAHGSWGDTTDGAGFLDLLGSIDCSPAAERVLLLGAGGAARSLALALAAAGSKELTASARRPDEAAELWSELDRVRFVGWRSPAEREALERATVVVNCTPIAGPDLPVPLMWLAAGALVVDLVYGETPTPWVWRAREAGHRALDGLGLLVYQARRSLALWLECPVPLEPLARAVGWPR